jgi:hypothetical protein
MNGGAIPPLPHTSSQGLHDFSLLGYAQEMRNTAEIFELLKMHFGGREGN